MIRADAGGPRVALTVAGSDPSGGAGIQADLKTFHRFGVYGEAAVTLLTVQNTESVQEVLPLDPEFVRAQMDAVIDDIPPHAVKTGALGTAGVVRAVAARLASVDAPVVVDPVMISKHGTALLDEEARGALRVELLPEAALVTPNVAEAKELSGVEITDVASMREACEAIAGLGPRAVLIKGGHLEADDATDLLFDGEEVSVFRAPRLATKSTHGTGCTLSAAITAALALGEPLGDAVARAKRFLTRALEHAPDLGRGYGPVDHHADID